jgi:hypothetical protein
MRVMEPMPRGTDQSLEVVLDDCRRRLLAGDSVEACLAAYPEHATELAGWLPLVVRLRALGSEPDPAYAVRARHRFQRQVVAAQERARASGRYRPALWLKHLALPLALVLILTASGLGLVQAASGTLPNSPLYPIREAQENVGGLLVRSTDGQASYQMQLANRDLADLGRAEAAHEPRVMRAVAVAMVQASNRATNLTLRASAPNRPALSARLRGLLSREHQALSRLATSAPGAAAAIHPLLQQLTADQRRLSR